MPYTDLDKQWRDSGLMEGAESSREWLQAQGKKSGSSQAPTY